MYLFFVQFLELYPEYKNRELYIAGHSYAGHYVPAVTTYFLRFQNPDINIKAIAMGNAWVEPSIQYPSYSTFGYQQKLFGVVPYLASKAGFALCQLLIKLNVFGLAYKECNTFTNLLQDGFFGLSKPFNPMNIRESATNGMKTPLGNGDLGAFLNRPDVISSIGVQNKEWDMCNGDVYNHLKPDIVKPFMSEVEEILGHKIKVLLYSGDLDFVCNWEGGLEWTNKLKWEGEAGFKSAEFQQWFKEEGVPAGEVKKYDLLTFVKVYDAGHIVPADQPESAYEMLIKFLYDI